MRWNNFVDNMLDFKKIWVSRLFILNEYLQTLIGSSMDHEQKSNTEQCEKMKLKYVAVLSWWFGFLRQGDCLNLWEGSSKLHLLLDISLFLCHFLLLPICCYMPRICTGLGVHIWISCVDLTVSRCWFGMFCKHFIKLFSWGCDL